MTDENLEQHGPITRFLAWRCENCPICRYARENPDTLISKIIHLHGKFCPFWRARERVYGKGPAR